MKERQSEKILSEKRLVWLDALKGFGVLLVVIGHMSGLPPHIGEYLYACIIPLFFLAGGYVGKREPNVKEYLKKKGERLLIPYAVYGCFLLLLKMRKVSGFQEAMIHWIGLLYSRYYLYIGDVQENVFFLVSGNSAHWFLTAFFVGSILAIPLLGKKDNYITVAVYFVLTIICNYLPILLPWSLDMGFLTAVFIWLGVKAREIHFGDLSPKIYSVIFLGGSIIYVCLINLNGFVNMSIRRYGERGIWSVFLFVLIGVLGTGIYASFFKLTENLAIAKLFAVIGRISLTVLCLHKFMFSVFEKTLGQLIREGYLNNCLKLLFVVLCSLILVKLYRILWSKYHLKLFQYL